MTSDSRPLTPWLLRFSESLEAAPTKCFAYDEVRQVSLVKAQGCWVEATSCASMAPATILTKVQTESTDDD